MRKIIGFYPYKNRFRRRGFSAMEAVISFAFLIIVAIAVLNINLNNQFKYDNAKSYEADMAYTASSIVKGIESTDSNVDFRVNLYNFVPVKDLDNKNTIILADNLRQIGGVYDLKDYGRKLEILLKFKFNPITFIVEKDIVLGKSYVYASVVKSEDETFEAFKINTLKVSERNKVTSTGTHQTFTKANHSSIGDTQKYLTKDKGNSGKEVFEYEHYSE